MAQKKNADAEKILLDVDPGHDDAMAMMLAYGDPRFDLLAITTVGGNQTLAKVTRNALAVCTIAGIDDVPVAAGADAPLVRVQDTAPDIHGDSGLDGPQLPDPTVTLDPRDGVDLIIETVMSNEPGTVTLVPTGPLTNIALALRKEPAIAQRVKRVSLMGGAQTRGNATPAAEFNIYVDPEAAAEVFAAGWPITMVGLDLTHQALADEKVIQRFTDLGGPLSQFIVDMLGFFGSTYRDNQGFAYPPVHDPCAVAALLPGYVTTKPAHVVVETEGTYTFGMTVVDFDDFRSMRGKDSPTNADVATELDVDTFWDLVVEAVTNLTSK